MKGNQLADALENAKSISEVAMLVKEKVIPMLRYQQASIDRLLGSGTKLLTDEEIDEISKEVWERPWLEIHRKFAKAILRKAQEK